MILLPPRCVDCDYCEPPRPEAELVVCRYYPTRPARHPRREPRPESCPLALYGVRL
jgi:hypothetical protein